MPRDLERLIGMRSAADIDVKRAVTWWVQRHETDFVPSRMGRCYLHFSMSLAQETSIKKKVGNAC
jgi:hypothetical protein